METFSRPPSRGTSERAEFQQRAGGGYVIEAKSGAKNDHPVYKSDAEQLSNAMDWFTAEYTTVATAVPVLVHPRAKFDKKAAVPHGCQVVTAGKLILLRDALGKLTAELADGDAFRDPERVGRLLTAHRLTADTFVPLRWLWQQRLGQVRRSGPLGRRYRRRDRRWSRSRQTRRAGSRRA